jgi:hypothetical protein
MPVTKTRYWYWLVSNNWYCSGSPLFLLLAGLFVAQGHESIGLAPPLRLVAEFAFRVGIRLGRRLPLGLA